MIKLERQREVPCADCHPSCHPGGAARVDRCSNFRDALQTIRFGVPGLTEWQLLRQRARQQLAVWAPAQDALFDEPGTLAVVPTRLEALEITAAHTVLTQHRRVSEQLGRE